MSDSRFKISFFSFLLASLSTLQAASPTTWKPETFASGQADAVVYINTLQAKNSMDPRLWELIQKDKNHALDAGKKSSVFQMKDRDLEIMFHFFLDSANPFHFHIQGEAHLSGDIAQDVKTLQSIAKTSNAIRVTEEKKANGSRYHVLLKPRNEGPPLALTFSHSNGKILFQIRTRNSGNLPDSPLPEPGGRSPFSPVGRYPDFSYVITAKPQKFASVPLFSTPRNKAFAEFLSATESLRMTGKIQGVFLLATGEAEFKSAARASSYYQQIAPLIKRYSPTGPKQDVISAKASLQGRSIRMEASVNLAVVWNFLSGTVLSAPEAQISDEPENGDDE